MRLRCAVSWDGSENIIQIATLVISVIGGGFAIYKWRNDKDVDRASCLDRLRNQFYAFKPDEILKKMGSSDVGSERRFEEDSEAETNDEMTRKSFFSFLAHICYLMDMKVISEKEFAFFKWQIVALLEKQCVYDMIASFYRKALPRRDEDKPFYSLVKFAIRSCEKEKRDEYKQLHLKEKSETVSSNDGVIQNCEQNNTLVSVSDTRVYNTHLDVLNGIFNLGYLGHMRGAARLPDGDLVWFPHIVAESDVPSPQERHQWYNVLGCDGLAIHEYMPEPSNPPVWSDDASKRYTFGKIVMNKKFVYRFYGVFIPDKIDKEKRCRSYKRIATVIENKNFTTNV